jgi:two-component SAPR family response regulator
MTAKPCCVLVDDERDALSRVEQILSRVCPDFPITSFSSSLEAWDFVKRNRVDLVITDFQMPGLNGLQLAAAIRSIDSTVPIVVISAQEIGDDAASGAASAFLWKAALWTELGPTLERVGINAARSGLGWMSAPQS